ncbi:hypothetical protein ADU90_12635 [Clostridium botulinum]|uniref:Uncharacterized protein n=1 Tax=Clostridium botulinum C/D str. DC5 TaxID=1443128 RepID=A0A0A0IKT2_CLOBO|nr:hypothetical protein Z955_02450 [Clostridium botulinum C/D str. DC5]KOC54180.1 hypothetical protein ADU90_12635 [Clostridium botulinum]KOC56524.1 hypothetical protein ADU89_02645 [Clostridium botulinum]
MKIFKKVRQNRDKFRTKLWKKLKQYNKLMVRCQSWQSQPKRNKMSNPFHFFKYLTIGWVLFLCGKEVIKK